MKWQLKPVDEARFRRWHVWWAWHPVKCKEDNTWYWCENVLRRCGEYDDVSLVDRIFCVPNYSYKPHYLKVIDE